MKKEYKHSIKQERVMQNAQAISSMALLNETNLIVGDEKGRITIWNLYSGECLQSIKAHKGNIVTSIKVLKNRLRGDGIQFASCGKDIKIWNFNGSKAKRLQTLSYKDGKIFDLEESFNGNIFSVDLQNIVKIWNKQQNKKFLQIPEKFDVTNRPTYLENKEQLRKKSNIIKLFALSNGGIVLAGNKSIKICDFSNAQQITLNEHTGIVSCALHLHSNHFASASYDKTIKVWDLQSGMCVATLKGHRFPIISIVQVTNYSGHQYENLVSADAGGVIKTWSLNPNDLNQYKCIKTVVASSNNTRLLALPRGKVASAGDNGEIQIWDSNFINNRVTEVEILVKKLIGEVNKNTANYSLAQSIAKQLVIKTKEYNSSDRYNINYVNSRHIILGINDLIDGKFLKQVLATQNSQLLVYLLQSIHYGLEFLLAGWDSLQGKSLFLDTKMAMTIGDFACNKETLGAWKSILRKTISFMTILEQKYKFKKNYLMTNVFYESESIKELAKFSGLRLGTLIKEATEISSDNSNFTNLPIGNALLDEKIEFRVNTHSSRIFLQKKEFLYLPILFMREKVFNVLYHRNSQAIPAQTKHKLVFEIQALANKYGAKNWYIAYAAQEVLAEILLQHNVRKLPQYIVRQALFGSGNNSLGFIDYILSLKTMKKPKSAELRLIVGTLTSAITLFKELPDSGWVKPHLLQYCRNLHTAFSGKIKNTLSSLLSDLKNATRSYEAKQAKHIVKVLEFRKQDYIPIVPHSGKSFVLRENKRNNMMMCIQQLKQSAHYKAKMPNKLLEIKLTQQERRLQIKQDARFAKRVECKLNDIAYTELSNDYKQEEKYSDFSSSTSDSNFESKSKASSDNQSDSVDNVREEKRDYKDEVLRNCQNRSIIAKNNNNYVKAENISITSPAKQSNCYNTAQLNGVLKLRHTGVAMTKIYFNLNS